MFERIKYARIPPVLVGALIFSSLTVVIVGKLAISEIFGVEPFPYLLHFFVIVLGAWFGGFRGGIFATILSSLAIWLVFLVPRYSGEPLSTRENLAVLFFNLEAVSLSYIVSKLRLSKRSLFQAFDELQQQQARYQLLLDNVSGYAVFFLNADGVVTDWNDGAQRFFGYGVGEVKGAPLTLFFKDLSFKRQWLKKLLKNPGQSWSENEAQVTRKDGSQLWAQISITPLRHTQAEFRGFGVVCRDLTLQKELTVQREQFLNDMSHELKTPLTSLKLWVDIMTRQQPSAQLEKLNQHTLKLTDLINTLLDLNHIQAGRFKLQQSEKPLSTIVKKIAEAAAAPGFTLGRLSKQPSLEVCVDLARLRIAVGIFSQALYDYVRLKAANNGGTLTVKVHAVSSHELQICYWSPSFTSEMLEPFIKKWYALLTHQRLPLSAEKSDSKGFFAAHILDLHGQLPILKTKASKGKTQTLVLNLRLFTHD